MFRYEFSRKTKNLFRILVVLLVVGFVLYLVGLITNTLMIYFYKVDGEQTFNPIECIKTAFFWKYSYITWIGAGVLIVIVLAYMFSMSDKRGKMDSQIKKDENLKFEYSGKETYGSARQMTESEIKRNFQVVKADASGVESTEGAVLFGFLNMKKKEIVAMPKSDWRKGTDYNRNIAVVGPPGSNKTRGFVMNYVIQKILSGESCIVVDTKGELYAKTCSFAKSHSFTVKILNLIEQNHSDGWDILGEVKNNPEMATELASTIIRNTGGAKSDPFWNDAEMNLLKAVILLKSVGQADVSNYSGNKQTMGDVYNYIATRNVTVKAGGSESMESDFMFLREYIPSHPAITPFLQFMNAGDDLCKKIIHGLANRLQLFQDKQLCNVLGTQDIDLEEAGKSKCIYYLRFSDQTSTYAFITALFFSFLSVKLVKFADSRADRRLPVPVNLVLDEFCNIGAIPDFEIKMATFRSRMINVVLIYQNNMLFQSTYPDGLWEAILATCDTFVVLGVGNEMTTAKFVSEMTGEATTSVSSNSFTLDTGQLRTTSSAGRRFVKNPDEVRNMDKRNALVFLRSCQVMEVVKMDYTQNPIYISNQAVFENEQSVMDHVTIVESVDINYEDYIIDAITRESYKDKVKQTEIANDNVDQKEKDGSRKPSSKRDNGKGSNRPNGSLDMPYYQNKKAPSSNSPTKHGGAHRPDF